MGTMLPGGGKMMVIRNRFQAEALGGRNQGEGEMFIPILHSPSPSTTTLFDKIVSEVCPIISTIPAAPLSRTSNNVIIITKQVAGSQRFFTKIPWLVQQDMV